MSILELLIILFQTSGDVSSGFQNQSGQPYSRFLAEVYLIYMPWDSLLVEHPWMVYMVSIIAGHFPHTCVSAEVGYWTRKGDLPLNSQMR